MNKRVLGEKIRKIRKEQKLSMEALCGDETDLSVRHLSRIEKGEALPNLATLGFLAKRFSLPISVLIDDTNAFLPREYLQLREKIFKSQSVYQNTDRVNKKEAWFDEVYEKYFEMLPEEEQLTIDLKRTIMDVNISKNVDFALCILEEYFEQAHTKKYFSLNDLLVLHLYFIYIRFKPYRNELFDKILRKVIESIEYSVDLELLTIERVLSSVGSFYWKHKKYELLAPLIQAADEICEKNYNMNSRPVWLFVEGKYQLFSEKNQELAKEKYKQAARFADVLKDEVLKKLILDTWQEDKLEFEKINERL